MSLLGAQSRKKVESLQLHCHGRLYRLKYITHIIVVLPFTKLTIMDEVTISPENPVIRSIQQGRNPPKYDADREVQLYIRHLSRLTFYSGVATNRWEYSSMSA